MHAQAVHANMGAKRDIKDLDEHFADIVGQPFIKDCAQKIAILFPGQAINAFNELYSKSLRIPLLQNSEAA